jgi:tRNA/tmRNA/rRNA uracil-C5-methylase (TrmA/RlmC/RlmD family)
VAPAALARLGRLAAEVGAPPPSVLAGAALGFRVRARLMVRGRAASPKIGIFQAGSHRIADIPRCGVHHPRVNEVAAAARAALRATGVAPYADRPHRGALRALQVVVERASGGVQVVLVGNADTPEPLAPLADALRASLGAGLVGLWWNGQPERSNAVLGPHWHCWWPDAADADPAAGCVRETIGGATVFFPPGAFGQSHLDLADRLVAQVHAWTPAGARVAELYAGCGPIGLGLLARSVAVTFVESAPDAVRGLELGLAARPEAERARARVVAAEAASAVGALAGAEVVIADPPRKGLDPALVAALAAAPPGQLVYVGCDLDSFERDAARLTAGGGLRLAELVACDLFPNTDHVETLARFVGDGPGDRVIACAAARRQDCPDLRNMRGSRTVPDPAGARSEPVPGASKGPGETAIP